MRDLESIKAANADTQGHGLQVTPTYGKAEGEAFKPDVRASSDGLDEERARNLIDAGVDAASAVIANWERGNLAGAVNALEEWRNNAQAFLDGEEPCDE